MPKENESSDERETVDRLLDDATYPSEIHGVQLRTQSYRGGSRRITVEIWEKTPNKSRLEVVSTETTSEFDSEIGVDQELGMNGLEKGGHLVIRNTGQLLKYDKENNEYQRYSFEAPEESAGSMIEPSLIGSSPQKNFDITLIGAEEIAGRETRILEFKPLEDAEPFYRRYDYVRIWTDEEYWIPMKHEAKYKLDDGTLVETNEFESIEFEGIEDEIFEFEPPKDAEEVGQTYSG